MMKESSRETTALWGIYGHKAFLCMILLILFERFEVSKIVSEKSLFTLKTFTNLKYKLN